MSGYGKPFFGQPHSHYYSPNHSQSMRRLTVDSGYFQAGLRSFPALGVFTDAHSHPSYTGEVDVPLDTFDKSLLAEIPSEQQQQAGQGPARVSLPPRYGDYPGLAEHHRTIRDDLHATPIVGSSSPSHFDPASSPTVSALQNRRFPHAPYPPYQYSHAQATLHQVQRRDNHPSEAQPPRQQAVQSGGPPVVQGIQLVCTDELPDKIRSIFPYEVLNAVQSRCFHTAYHTNDNLVLAAPTGSGKTLVMELAIARLLVTAKTTDFKVVYMAPIKALCAERQEDWQRKFQVHGLNCAELTGDTDYNQLRKVQQANIIITTPEKWDSVTRKWRDNSRLVQLIKLFLVDEVHILKDSRGATLEAVVSRMKSVGTPIRFVALSATVPNSEDIATWLGKNSTSPNLPAQREVFDESFRPVKLEKHVYGFQGGSNDFQFDVKLRNRVPDVILRHSEGKPTMVFCMTRKSSAQTAHTLASLWCQSPNAQKPWNAPGNPPVVKDAELRTPVSTGVAFHHAGMSVEDRQAVEQGFIAGTINVICSTSTLAVGVNLPCYMVILQGTVAYGDTGLQEYSDLEVMQMLGRAGRPQYERSACAAILTREDKVERYRKIVSGQDLLESTLHRNLIEHLNAEIGLGTIFDLASAKRWLASTFLCVRLQRNPGHYQLREDVGPLNESEILQRICDKDVSLLKDANLVKYDGHLKCTEFGDAMARYCVKYETMKTFVGIPPKAEKSEILSILTQASEFLDVRLRAGEKMFYRELNKANGIRYPIRVDIALSAHKVSLILQSHLGSVKEPAGSKLDKYHAQYHTDTFPVFSHANRLIRCIIDCQLSLKDAVTARNALELARSLAARAWDNTPSILKQVQGIGDVFMRKLAANGINSIDTLFATEPHRINLILGKQQPFGAQVIQKLSSFPNLMVSIKEIQRNVRYGEGVMLKLKCEVGFLNQTCPLQFGKVQIYVCFLLEDSNGQVIDFRRFGARKLANGEEILLTVELTKPTVYIRSHVMCDEIAGTSRSAELQLPDIPSSVYPERSKTIDSGGVKAAESAAASTAGHDHAIDVFDDDGVGDDELLAAVGADETIDSVEVVQDIDELMREMEGASTRKSQAKPSNSSTQRPSPDDDDDGDHAEFKDPVQLANGRWTCQHLCKGKGLECKHKCCREGVAKPRRRPRKSTKSEDNSSEQQKITAMKSVSGITKLKERSEKPSSLAIANTSKKRKLSSVDDLGDYDGGRSMETTIAGATSRNPSTRRDMSLDYDDGEVASADIAYLDADFWEPDDCDWNLPPSFQTGNDSIEERAAEIQDQTYPATNLPDRLPAAASSLQPPLNHATMTDVHLKPEKSLFVTGQSSSPTKSTAPKGRADQERSSTDFPVDPFGSSGFGTGTTDLLGPRATTSMAHEAPLPTPAGGDSTAKDPAVTTHQISNSAKGQSEQVKKKMLWQKDQMKLWDHLPAWMYEDFGRYAEFV